jgi:sarcinarray family protein
MRRLLLMFLLALFLATVTGMASGKSIKAYFNGQEATVSGVDLRPGEPFTVDLYVTPDGEADVYAELDEPGIDRAYDRLSGDELVPTAFKRCNASSGARFHWVLAASGRWTNGTAPANIYYQIDRRNSNNVIGSGYFTVVDAFILPAMPTVETIEPIDEKVQKTPGPDIVTALAGILMALLLRRRRMVGVEN